MFSRYDCCYHCSHHHRHLSFRRGMAAMLILVLLVFALLHGQKPGTHHHPTRAHATPRPSGRAGPGHDPTRPRARHVPHRLPGRRSGHKSAGLTVSWTNFHGIDLPVSTSAGPRTMRNGLASGFARSPAGALLAAINIAVRTAARWGPAIFRPTITRQVTGPAAGALLRADTDAYAQLRRASPGSRSKAASSSQAVEEAYRFVAYTPAAAIVEVVTSSQGASGSLVLVMTRLRVVWLVGDWRLYAPPDGGWANSATAISSLAGYTLLSAGR